MSLAYKTHVELPANLQSGGFDHAVIHFGTNRLYVAHSVNNSLEVVDSALDRYLFSMPELSGVAGALVSQERNLVFTSNRGEDTISILKPGEEDQLVKIPVGIHPNGMSFDPQRGLLLAANVGDPSTPYSFTLSMVDIQKRAMIHSIPVAGRTRWSVYSSRTEQFFTNISEPAQIVVVPARQADRITCNLDIPASGPHGLDLDPDTGRLFCACDDGKLVTLAAATGKILNITELSGKPDVIFFNPGMNHLYLAIGDPGVIDVIDTDKYMKLESIATEKGTHTLALDPRTHKVYAFAPQSHLALVYIDTPK